MTSRYSERFESLKKEGHSSFVLVGNTLLVEKIKAPERKVGSLFVPTDVKQRGSFDQDIAVFVRVLAVGEGYYDDVTKEDLPLDVQVGDIILVGQLSVKYFSFFGELQNYEPDTIGITRESEIQLRFRGEEGYKEAFRILNGQGEAHTEFSEPTQKETTRTESVIS